MKNYLLLLLTCTLIYAQHNHDHNHDHNHNHGHHSSSIVGTIIDSDGDPIEYATVSLVDNSSKDILMGQLSLIDGRFKFNHVHTGQYKVAISFMGFETWESDLIIISGEVNKKDLATIGFVTPNCIFR